MEHESIGTVNAQGNTVLHKMPQQIRAEVDLYYPSPKGEMLTLDRYTGPVHDTSYGKIQSGDYITFGMRLTIRWLAQNPTKWEKVR